MSERKRSSFDDLAARAVGQLYDDPAHAVTFGTVQVDPTSPDHGWVGVWSDRDMSAVMPQAMAEAIARHYPKPVRVATAPRHRVVIERLCAAAQQARKAAGLPTAFDLHAVGQDAPLIDPGETPPLATAIAEAVASVELSEHTTASDPAPAEQPLDTGNAASGKRLVAWSAWATAVLLLVLASSWGAAIVVAVAPALSHELK